MKVIVSNKTNYKGGNYTKNEDDYDKYVTLALHVTDVVYWNRYKDRDCKDNE